MCDTPRAYVETCVSTLHSAQLYMHNTCVMRCPFDTGPVCPLTKSISVPTIWFGQRPRKSRLRFLSYLVFLLVLYHDSLHEPVNLRCPHLHDNWTRDKVACQIQVTRHTQELRAISPHTSSSEWRQKARAKKGGGGAERR